MTSKRLSTREKRGLRLVTEGRIAEAKLRERARRRLKPCAHRWERVTDGKPRMFRCRACGAVRGEES